MAAQDKMAVAEGAAVRPGRQVRTLALTAAHIARIHRPVEETPPGQGFRPITDDEVSAHVAAFLALDPAPGGPLRLFAYGSLLWKAEVAHVAEMPGLVRGWHRSFCMRLPRFRGTEEFPGLMMALDRGGACRGVLMDLEPGEKAAQLDKLFRRELPYVPASNAPRWLRVATAQGPVPALGFVMDQTSPLYTGRQTAEAVAEVLSRACGYGGTGAEYLMNTVDQLERRGIHDSLLWRLQAMVAARIEAHSGAGAL